MRRARTSDAQRRAPKPAALSLLAGWVASALLFGASTVGAQPVGNAPPGARLPSPSTFDEFRRKLVNSTTGRLAASIHRRSGSASTCRFDGEADATSCRCLNFSDGDWQFASEHTTWRSDGSDRWKTLTVAAPDLALFARRVEADSDGVTARGVVLSPDDGSTVEAERLVIQSEKIVLEDVRWARQTLDSAPRLASPCAGEEFESTEHFLAAARARWTPEVGWTFEGLRTRHPKVPLGDVSMKEASRTGGPLPPRIAVAPVGVGGFGRLLDGKSGVGGGIDVVPTQWYGVGPTVTTEGRSDDQPFRRHAPSLLDARLTWDRESEAVGAYAVGDFRRGSRRTHVDVRAESVSRDAYWQLLRLGDDQMPRRWRDSKAGVALSGDDYSLDLTLGRTARARAPSRPTDDETTAGTLTFGADHPVADHVALETNVAHRTEVRSRSANLHGTLLYGGLRGDWSPLRGVDLVAELGGRMASHLVTDENVGDAAGASVDAVTAAQLLAHAGMGLRITGAFEKARHELRPRIDIYREIGGAGPARESIWTDDSSWTRAPGSRVPRWTSMTAMLEQDWWAGNGARLSTPIGLLWNGAGVRETLGRAPHPFGRAEFARGATQLAGGAMVDPERTDAPVRPWASIDLRGESFDTGFQTSALAPADQAVAVLDGGTAGLSQASRMLQTRIGQSSDLRWWHRLYATWRFPTIVARASWMGQRNLGRWAVTAGATRPIPALGWGLSVDGVAAERLRRWGVVVGVRPVGPG